MNQAAVTAVHRAQLAPICILHSYAVTIGAYSGTTVDDCVFAYCQEVGVPCADLLQAQRAISGLFVRMQEHSGHGSGYEYLKFIHDGGRNLYFRKAKDKCECRIENTPECDIVTRLREDNGLVALVCLNGPPHAHSIVATFDFQAAQLVVADPNQINVVIGGNDIRQALQGEPYAAWAWGHQLVFKSK
jgi:hypothetical protein